MQIRNNFSCDFVRVFLAAAAAQLAQTFVQRRISFRSGRLGANFPLNMSLYADLNRTITHSRFAATKKVLNFCVFCLTNDEFLDKVMRGLRESREG